MAVPSSVESLPKRTFAAGEALMEEGGTSHKLLFLAKGTVEVTKQGVSITKVRERGAMFGEMSVLLDCPHTATVTALDEVECYIADDGAAFFETHADVVLYVSRILARRLESLNRYLIDVKAQFAEQEGHLGMVDGVLEALMSRHPKKAPAPPVGGAGQ